jgi:ketosteroid isomerase-like protein
MSKNLSTIQSIYAAFGRGDIPAILEHVSEDCVWEYASGTHGVPWLQQRRGREGAAAFFATVGAELEFKSFTVNTIVGTDHLVIALASTEAVVKRTGKTIRETDEPHIWHFDDKGRIIKFRHAADTYQHAMALKA